MDTDEYGSVTVREAYPYTMWLNFHGRRMHPLVVLIVMFVAVEITAVAFGWFENRMSYWINFSLPTPAYFGACRPVVSVYADQLFRRKATTHFGDVDHLFR